MRVIHDSHYLSDSRESSDFGIQMIPIMNVIGGLVIQMIQEFLVIQQALAFTWIDLSDYWFKQLYKSTKMTIVNQSVHIILMIQTI